MILHSAPYFTAIGVLTIVHAWSVVKARWDHDVRLGDGGIEALELKIRVFGNFIEYAPLGLVFLIALEIVQAPIWFVHLCGASLLLGRILHATGLGRTRERSFGRYWGTVLTWASLLVASIGVMVWGAGFAV